MTELRSSLPPLPKFMRSLPVDDRGYPVPWFVEWIDGKPEFRVINAHKWDQAILERRCWVCGERITGSIGAFVVGPMCAVNRVSSEPPSHVACAEFSAKACPFLTIPKAVRRDHGLPQDAAPVGGEMIMRNPGATLVWLTRSYEVVSDGKGGRIIIMGDPVETHWYAKGRKATRAEVVESIESGLPILRDLAAKQGHGAMLALSLSIETAMKLVPKEPVS